MRPRVPVDQPQLPSPVPTSRPATRPLELSGGAVDLALGLVLTAAAATLWLAAAGFDEVDHTGVGPATFPRGVSALLGATALIIAGRGIAALAGFAAREPVLTHRPLAVALGIGLVCAFPPLMTTAGYYAAVAVWLPAFLLVAGYRRPVGIVLATAGFVGFAWLVFQTLLGVRLP